MGFFAMVGPLQVFVSSHVSVFPILQTHPIHPPTLVMKKKHRDIMTILNGMLSMPGDLVVIDRFYLKPPLYPSLSIEMRKTMS